MTRVSRKPLRYRRQSHFESYVAQVGILKGYKLLQGYRGAPAADLDAVCDAIARVSEFAADYADRVEEIDVNPLLARPDGAVALDALIVLRD